MLNECYFRRGFISVMIELDSMNIKINESNNDDKRILFILKFRKNFAKGRQILRAFILKEGICCFILASLVSLLLNDPFYTDTRHEVAR